MRSLTETMDRISARVVEEAERRESLPTSTPGLTLGMAITEAAERLFEKRIPKAYAPCFPEHVPEISGIRINESQGVCFRGNPGIGKTYAATAFARKLVSGIMPKTNPATGEMYYPDSTLLWVSSPYLLARIRSTFRDGAREREIDIIDECLAARVMILDDLGAEKTTEFTGATLYSIISGRRNAERYTIVTTNQSLDEIDAWEPRIASRLAEMESVKLPNRDRRLSK